MTKLEKLTKSDLLNVLEHIDQHFWPPRPTKQTVKTLREAIKQAQSVGRVSSSFAGTICDTIKSYQNKLHERRLAWNLKNNRKLQDAR